jgi:plastocyanin
MRPTTGRNALLLTVLLSPLLLLGAQLAGAWHQDAARPKPSSHVSVTIKNYSFLPHVLHVRVGTTVTWTNLDTNVGHTVTSGNATDARRWRSSGLFFGGQRFSVTFHTPGTYPYFCMPHFYNPAMHGVIVVTK